MKLAPGLRVTFSGERQAYTVRTASARHAVCTKQFNLQRTTIYTVIDWERGVRGTENLVFGMGAETAKHCREMLARLDAGETEVSHRNYVRLRIVEVKNALKRSKPGGKQDSE